MPGKKKRDNQKSRKIISCVEKVLLLFSARTSLMVNLFLSSFDIKNKSNKLENQIKIENQ